MLRPTPLPLNALLSVCVLIWSALFVACGPSGGTPPPSTPGASLGETCGEQTPCQDGLTCAPTSVCVHVRCTKSVDPEDTCAQKLGLEPERVQCNSDGTCTPKQVINESCEDDSACVFGFVCEEGTCVETCLSDASCPGQNRACLERPSDPNVRVCQDQYCGDMPDPQAFCDQKLNFEQGGAICTPEGCREQNLMRGESCQYSSSCSGSDVCDEQVCRALCRSSYDCLLNEECADLPNAIYSICRPVEDCTQAQNPDGYCQRRFIVGGMCDTISQTCEESDRLLPIVQVKNSHFFGEQEFCEAAQQEGVDAWTGADLYAAFIRHRRDVDVIGVGRVVEREGYPNQLEAGPYSSIPSSLSEGLSTSELVQCPIGGFADEEVLSLGCYGTFYMSFFDEDGAVFPIDVDLHELVFFEFDDQCGGINEDYTVSLCVRKSDFSCAQPPCVSCDIDYYATGSGTIEL